VLLSGAIEISAGNRSVPYESTRMNPPGDIPESFRSRRLKEPNVICAAQVQLFKCLCKPPQDAATVRKFHPTPDTDAIREITNFAICLEIVNNGASKRP
jgi:hypothetical protein